MEFLVLSVVEVSPQAAIPFLYICKKSPEMTRILFFLSAFAFLSCNSSSKPTEETTGTNDTIETAETEVAFKSLSSPVPYAGSWISQDYLQIIQKDQSPRKAQETSEEVFITLPANTLKPATMVYNFHEA